MVRDFGTYDARDARSLLASPLGRGLANAALMLLASPFGRVLANALGIDSWAKTLVKTIAILSRVQYAFDLRVRSQESRS
ncbi:hypothetical protein A6770_16305 [Nostoc minutum NIES-26]|uniref:Uncharacterized protein n=1 Tax=Nostoc minutum NIES-26 TaxID=1844469 RepID=A0A367RJ91_9NOSO|nr:hypothetical protein A6770_16305 [Nostoc minutum NIES-26]